MTFLKKKIEIVQQKKIKKGLEEREKKKLWRK
jgi:hypothetical protein